MKLTPRAVAILVMLAVPLMREEAQTPAGAPASATPPSAKRLIGVYDQDTGDPIVGAEVRNMLNGLSQLTSATGTLTFFIVDTTGGLLSVKKLGYEPLTMAVSNAAKDTLPLTLLMKRVAQELPTVVTNAKTLPDAMVYRSPGLRGFEERRASGFGHFVSEVQMRKHDGSRLSDVISSLIPGARVIQGRGAALYLVGHRAGGSGARTFGAAAGGSSNCYITIFLDGTMLYSMAGGLPSMNPPVDFSTLMSDTYAGIEYYASGASMPIQYSKTDAGCGTVLLWTRER